ncbi:putative metalloprotease with PDZ domain [Flavobacterium endophyticum]|uniref:Putative metalloprotease with PDZ domain n=1 Tax=Flavobacterium endophyticum TaxID=1540163 RepID=A0A495M910_9FLAO|nr:peptidase M61 [Flavobacterium endophyticum]RKS21730.1 putative metalloprotease with PDZ domain [Flavobacterium endophyticum]
MRKIVYSLAVAALLWSCKPSENVVSNTAKNEVQVQIDLTNIKDDKVMVTVTPPAIKSEKIAYHLPKIIPGTYSEDDYGKFLENVKAYDAKGNTLVVAKVDDNSWTISDAKKLAKLTYWVNDTYDIEGTHDIFSPAGTNIEAGKNIMLNTHGFVGYFKEFVETPYQVSIAHPATLWGATSMTDKDAADTNDVFTVSRYSELVENPIMYSKPDYTTFTVNGMEILIAVYSPNGVFTAESITPEMKTMMTAQKNFLGKFNSTKKYSVLIYLSDTSRKDAQGFGALEHPTATTVVMPEAMPKEQLAEQLKDVVSHEFFHIVTPLTIHSKEIQFFDYNNPKMSEHLWMYEGVTEYFANLFQVNQGLITEDEFYQRMATKIANASTMDDTMPFTKMSSSVLQKPYKDQYQNVYEKGALIAMCLDIQIRQDSNGQRGILDLMQKLSNEYGTQKAFDDTELFDKIESLTSPEVRKFLDTYVAGPTPIPYDVYFAKMGVTKAMTQVAGNVFLKGQEPNFSINPQTKEIYVLPGAENLDFYKSLGIKPNDIISEINGTKYNLDNIYDMIIGSIAWKENDPITVKIKRGGKEMLLKGTVKLPHDEIEGFQATDASKAKLREAWLKG